MSLILKGIDRPERGEMLNIKITDNGMVWVTKKDGWDYYSGYAIQIPKDHGGLIPLEDVFRDFPELEPYRQGLTGLTILEAEE